jgi:iron complex transport system substrate-binding protein
MAAPLLFAGGAREQTTEKDAGEQQASRQEEAGAREARTRSTSTRAKHLSIEYFDGHKVLTVTNPWQNADKTYIYVLYQRGDQRPEGYENGVFVEVPVQSMVTMSTTYIAYMEALGVLDALAGVDNFQFIYSPEVRKTIDTGALIEVGSGPEVNVELLYEMEPDVIMTYGLGTQWDTHPKLIEAGLDVVINAEHTELTPLARSEWIKFIAAFFNKEEEANRIFEEMVARYQTMQEMTAEIEERPTVLNNAPYQGSWWVAGGRSHAARLIEDAGGDYLWSDTSEEGSLMLDFEAVFEKAVDADYWINPGTWSSLDQALAEDSRYAEFKAFQEGAVYNNNRRMNEYGFSDYWESGITNPDIILADLIKIFHPELLPDHELVYFRKLE